MKDTLERIQVFALETFSTLVLLALFVSCASGGGGDDILKDSPEDMSASLEYRLLIFNANASDAVGTMENQQMAVGVAQALSPSGFSRLRYTFAGWATSPDGPVVHEDKANYTIGKENVTLYGRWYWTETLNPRDSGPSGGFIFYMNPHYKNEGWRYLEAAASDVANCPWGTYNFSVTGAGGVAIGTGIQNTLDIVAGDPLPNKAADICDQYSVTYQGILYEDWFLPSEDELYQIYQNLKLPDVGGFTENVYWSSKEGSSTTGRGVRFLTVVRGGYHKSLNNPVRPVRRF